MTQVSAAAAGPQPHLSQTCLPQGQERGGRACVCVCLPDLAYVPGPVAACPPSSSEAASSFPLRLCNIEDPLNPRNNLGYSISRQSLHLLQHSIAEGRRHLDYVLTTFDSVTWIAPPPPQQPPDAPPSSGSTDLRRSRSHHADLNNEPPPSPPSALDNAPSPEPFPTNQQRPPAPLAMAMVPTPSGWLPVGGLPPSPSAPHPSLHMPVVAAFFPRLLQLYHDPASRRSDLLNHPCESRTGMLVCDEAPLSAEQQRQSSFLKGEVSRFWSVLASATARQEEEQEDDDDEESKSVEPASSSSSSASSSASSSDCCPATPESQPEDGGSAG